MLHGSLESLFIGCGSAAWLSMCSLSMSDMRTEWYGEMGVKMAWGECKKPMRQICVICHVPRIACA